MSFLCLPCEDSSYAGMVDTIFLSMVILCGTITLGVFATIIGFAIRYRSGSPADRSHVTSHKQQFHIEIAWTVIPLIIFIGLFIWAGNIYYNMFSPPSKGLPIYVVGKQWMWKIEHPGGQREINELHIPAGRTVVLTMISQDVIHDFDIPAFRVKHDVLPGRYVRMWFKATQPGIHHLYCGQYCGDHHSLMVGTVNVMSPQDYKSWLQRSVTNGPSETLAAEGLRCYHAFACSSCHDGNRGVPVPSLVGLYQQPVTLQSGEVVIANDDYIREAILHPSKNVPVGYAPNMPSFQGLVSEEQIIALIAYIKSQRSNSEPIPDEEP